MDGDEFLSNILVAGEISNFKNHTSGHWYFSLKDANSAINCVMFKGFASAMAYVPKNGQQTLVRGRVSVYDKTGQYQIYCNHIIPMGEGEQRLAFERLKEKLRAEGLFGRKRDIPGSPCVAAVVTSPTGAALRDIIRLCRRRCPHIKLLIAPALMQGADAPQSIASAIKMVNQWNDYNKSDSGADAHRHYTVDLIIVARGGGSAEDLWAFNEEATARAIFSSNIPVVSAVGHETDFTIADFVADMRASTPSAAVELALPSLSQMSQAVTTIMVNLTQDITEAIGERQMLMDNIVEKIERQSGAFLQMNKSKLTNAVSRLEAMSPIKTLARGYALVFDDYERDVRKVNQLSVGDFVTLMFADGSRRAEIL
jgi:exodeoxyribonuclease VII large subunit